MHTLQSIYTVNLHPIEFYGGKYKFQIPKSLNSVNHGINTYADLFSNKTHGGEDVEMSFSENQA